MFKRLMLFLTLALAIPAAAQNDSDTIKIDFPPPIYNVSGVVTITGTVNPPDLQSYFLEQAAYDLNNPDAAPVEKIIGERFNAMRKVVYSTSLERADWQGTSISRSIDPAEVARLKAESENGIRLDGSISIVQQMTRLGLVDEYRLMVHPVVLGKGRPLFEERVDLELIRSEPLRSGVVVLTYGPAGASG